MVTILPSCMMHRFKNELLNNQRLCAESIAAFSLSSTSSKRARKALFDSSQTSGHPHWAWPMPCVCNDWVWTNWKPTARHPAENAGQSTMEPVERTIHPLPLAATQSLARAISPSFNWQPGYGGYAKWQAKRQKPIVEKHELEQNWGCPLITLKRR